MKYNPVLLLVVSLALTGSMALAQSTKPFPDVPKDHWAYQAVMELKEKGILIGYPDGSGAQSLHQTAREEKTDKVQAVSDGLAETPTHVLLRLVGVSHGDDKGQKWWGWRGNVFDGPVIERGSNSFADWKDDDKAHGLKPCLIVVAFDTQLKADLGYAANFLSSDGKPVAAIRDLGFSIEPMRRGQRHSDLEFSFGAPAAMMSGTLRVGVASATWKQTAIFKRQDNKSAIEGKDGSVHFSLTRKSDGMARLTIEGDTMDMQRRFIVLDKSGHTYPLDVFSEPATEPEVAGQVFDPRLRFQDVKEVRLQKRPFDWIDFLGVALEPN